MGRLLKCQGSVYHNTQMQEIFIDWGLAELRYIYNLNALTTMHKDYMVMYVRLVLTSVSIFPFQPHHQQICMPNTKTNLMSNPKLM